jgi:hypothetical protein
LLPTRELAASLFTAVSKEETAKTPLPDAKKEPLKKKEPAKKGGKDPAAPVSAGFKSSTFLLPTREASLQVVSR